MNLPMATVVFAVVCILLASIACVELLRRRRLIAFFTGHFHVEQLELGATNVRIGHGAKTCLASPPSSQKDATVTPPPPRSFTWFEVESSTANFTSAVIGKGGFSTVYAAHLQDSAAAVKLYHSSKRLRHAFLMELDVLPRLHHPNIVGLLGYCDEREDQGVLILDYISNGSLYEKLHGVAAVLPWGRRTSIAYRLAKALHYLHDDCELHIVHGDIKASNVLLDGTLNPVLCDFGCSRMGFSALVRPPAAMTGSPGYIDPHYIRTGMVSKKSDVYSFGVLLLELITGAEAFDAETERLLTAAAGGIFLEAAGLRLSEIVDCRLSGEYDAAEAAAMASISALCIGENPTLRPTMEDVVRMMEEKVLSSMSAVDCKT
ncbi:putative receptor-like protein kinase [Platanthera zijinensis]|uniref:Receptor-like protein kinase n=1 Tax=Platanthera zijinensis TaxID=2320716 RepID=A0AAP0C5X7_9ASPA